MKTNNPSESELLRKKAEELLNTSAPVSIGKTLYPTPDTRHPLPDSFSKADMLKLIHELEVHQIELELQNEELLLTRSAAEVAARKFEELYDFAPTGYFTLTPSGEIIQLNLIGAKMLGRDRSKLINKQLAFFVSSDTKPIFKTFLERIFASQTKETCGITLVADGALPMYVHLTGIITENGNLCLVTIIDVTDKKQAEQALLLRELQYRDMFDKNTAVKLIIEPLSGKILNANQAAAEFYGYTIDCLETTNISQINTLPGDQVQAEMARANSEKCKYFNFRHRLASGEVRDVEVYSSPIRWEGIGCLYSIIHDISSRKKAEELIKLKNEQLLIANAEKDKFFSIIAHDLRSPFNAFLGFTQLMVEELDTLTLKEIQQIAVRMRNSATNLFKLLGNLLDWSLLERGLTAINPKTFLLMTGIADSIQLVKISADEKEIKIAYDIPEVLMVFADTNMFGSILRNLVFNAVKFTSRGGKININARAMANNQVEISISDTGIGMNLDILDKLFRVDEQANRKGTEGELSTGLGLLICKEMVEKSGGRIWVESKEGKGSTFYFTIPEQDRSRIL